MFFLLFEYKDVENVDNSGKTSLFINIRLQALLKIENLFEKTKFNRKTKLDYTGLS